MGGVGSLALAGLLDTLVLRHQPTLCFVECSLADAGGATPRHSIPLALQSILGDLTSAGIVPVLLHLPRTDISPQVHERVVEIYSEVGRIYGVAEIDLRLLADDGHFRDGVHTSKAFSKIIAQRIVDALPDCLDDLPVSHVRAEEQRIRLLPASSGVSVRGNIRQSQFRLALPTVIIGSQGSWKLTAPGLAIAGLYVIAGPMSGVIRLTARKASITVQVWDEWCERPRIQFINLPEDMMVDDSLLIEMTDFDVADRNAIGGPPMFAHKGSSLEIAGGAVIHP